MYAGAAHEDIEPQVAEAEVYEAEFVLPMAPVAEGADDGQGAAAGAGSTPKAEEGAGALRVFVCACAYGPICCHTSIVCSQQGSCKDQCDGLQCDALRACNCNM
eukprot:1160869-Pelagomonas_calceolata.AAC.6